MLIQVFHADFIFLDMQYLLSCVLYILMCMNMFCNEIWPTHYSQHIVNSNFIFKVGFEVFFCGYLLTSVSAVISYSAEQLYEEDDLALSSFTNPSLTQASCTDCINMTSSPVVTVSLERISIWFDLISVIKTPPALSKCAFFFCFSRSWFLYKLTVFHNKQYNLRIKEWELYTKQMQR